MNDTEINETTKHIELLHDTNVDPKFIPSIYNLLKHFEKNKGLTRHQLILLIQDKTKPRLTRKQIENTLQAIAELEKAIIKN